MDEKIKKYIDRCSDPIYFSRHILKENPWNGEEKIMQAVAGNEKTAVRSGHSIGKSYTSASLVLWFLYKHYPSKVITTAPSERQVRDVLWSEITTKFAKCKTVLGGRATLKRIDIDTDWFTIGFKSRDYDPEMFQGFHSENIMLVFDEASGIQPLLWQAGSGLMTGKVRKWVVIGNPLNPSGNFADCFKSSSWKKLHFSCFDSPNITGERNIPALVDQAWIDDRREEWGEDSPLWQSRVLGEFPTETEDTLIKFSWIQDAVQREKEAEGDRYMGVDVARFGADSSVIISISENNVLCSMVEERKRDTMQVTGRAKIVADEEKSRTIGVDVIGIGSGVADRLKEQKYNVRDVNVAEKSSKPDRFKILRDEIWWNMREVFKEGEISIRDEGNLIYDLSDVRFSYDSAGRIVIESKESMKKRGKKSPDFADALGIALYVKQKGAIDYSLPDNVGFGKREF